MLPKLRQTSRYERSRAGFPDFPRTARCSHSPGHARSHGGSTQCHYVGHHRERDQNSSHVPLPLLYRGMKLNCAYRADMVVAGLVLVEVKAVDTPHNAHRRQVNTYLRLGDYRVGLLLNFGAATMK